MEKWVGYCILQQSNVLDIADPPASVSEVEDNESSARGEGAADGVASAGGVGLQGLTFTLSQEKTRPHFQASLFRLVF